MDHLSLNTKRLEVYAPHFGEPGQVFEDSSSNDPRVDVVVYPPQGPRAFTTLITSGMSDRRMFLSETIPHDERPDYYRRELVWYVREANKVYVDWMQWLGRFPFIDHTWLGHGHTVQWHEPLFPGSELRHFLLTYSVIKTDDEISKELTIDDDPVGVLWINPITPQEWRLKKEMRVDALLDLFDRKKHPFIFDSGRSSYT